MKYRLLIILLLLNLSHCLLWANNIIIDSTKNRQDKTEHLFSLYKNIYRYSPSTLSLWQPQNTIYFDFGYKNHNGNFHHPQRYKNFSEFSFTTASLYQPKQSEWVYYGQFSYANGRAGNVENNLSYEIEQYGSPYYYLIKKSGDWNLQNYLFNAVASRKINNKLYLGAKIRYDGKQFFRLNDTRNTQTKLDIVANLSATYQFKKKNSIGISAFYNLQKTEPSFYNKFSHASAELEYNTYLIAGMGTYFKGASFPSTIKYNIPGFHLQWLKYSENKTSSIVYTFKNGLQTWNDKSVLKTDKQNIIAKYKINNHTLHYAYLKKNSKTLINGLATFDVALGKGYKLNRTSEEYTQNYDYTNLSSQLKLSIEKPDALLNTYIVGTKLNYNLKKDKNYAYSTNYSSVNIYGGIKLSLPLAQQKIAVKIIPGYHKNINFENKLGAAKNNLYPKWVGLPLLSYTTSDYIYAQTSIAVINKIKHTPFKIELTADYHRPTKINYQYADYILFNTDFLKLKCNLKIYF